MKDQNSPEYNQGLAILRSREYAHLHYVPNGIEQVGLMIEGQRALSERAKPATPAKPAPVIPKKAPASQVAFGAGTGTTRTPASTLERSGLENEMKQLAAKRGASARDVARFLSKADQLTSTRS
jgi:hypothetical protein